MITAAHEIVKCRTDGEDLGYKVIYGIFCFFSYLFYYQYTNTGCCKPSEETVSRYFCVLAITR